MGTGLPHPPEQRGDGGVATYPPPSPSFFFAINQVEVPLPYTGTYFIRFDAIFDLHVTILVKICNGEHTK